MASRVMLVLGCVMMLQAPPTGKVDSTFDKSADFAALRTYKWLPGTPAFNPVVHEMIVAAVEAEMDDLGFTKAESGADVTLAYYAMAITNVDLEALDKIEREGTSRAAANKTLGKLVIVMRNAAQKQIWTAATREYLEPTVEKFRAPLRIVTGRLFETYPTRRPRG